MGPALGRFGRKMAPLPYEAEGRMGALTVTASAARLGARLGDGDPLEDMGMFTYRGSSDPVRPVKGVYQAITTSGAEE